MSRRSIAAHRKSKSMDHGQQAIWNVIREAETFTITDVWGRVDMHRGSIINYVKRLCAGGYVRKSDNFASDFIYELVKDSGHHAPRLKRDGARVTQGAGNQNMWRAMRGLSSFNPTDLVAHATTDTTTVSMHTAKKYCTALSQAGYLRVLQKASPPKQQAIYQLINDTGPDAPKIMRVKRVFDTNLNCVMPNEGAVQ